MIEILSSLCKHWLKRSWGSSDIFGHIRTGPQRRIAQMLGMHSIPQTTETLKVNLPWEKHYTVSELAERWGFGRTTIRRWFEEEADVLRQGENRLRRNRKRPYTSLRIPESVAMRVYRRHTEV